VATSTETVSLKWCWLPVLAVGFLLAVSGGNVWAQDAAAAEAAAAVEEPVGEEVSEDGYVDEGTGEEYVEDGAEGVEDAEAEYAEGEYVEDAADADVPTVDAEQATDEGETEPEAPAPAPPPAPRQQPRTVPQGRSDRPGSRGAGVFQAGGRTLGSRKGGAGKDAPIEPDPYRPKNGEM